MPIMLDVSKEVELAPRDRNLESGVELILPEEAKTQVVITKYISNNPLRADFQPEGSWFEQVTMDPVRPGGRPRIMVEGSDGEPRSISIDDGCILDIVGKMTRLVGIIQGRPPMTLEEVDDFNEIDPSTPVPIYQQWDFYLTRALITNGPEGRENLARTEEQKRLNAQSDMFDAFRQMFEQMGAGSSPSAKALIDAGPAKAKTK